ncbi:glycosyltransferase [Paenibacillus albicereus]|uniref:Glycosyltransferase n=1 Tax=Paenibacillus albicereus TaxID=2726185 RepID=A0A6H2H0P7_9BACL|nr:glycosyltransferase [Paenibacillus albicereus]QJC53263.1 glycosyltransferase [Paenibacillus albicereus]
MRIALIQALGYFISYSGACKANRNLMEGLARIGHECLVLTATPNDNGLSDEALFADKLARGEVERVRSDEACDVYRSAGVEIHALRDAGALREFVRERMEAFRPEWVLVTEDRVPAVLESALLAAPGQVVEIAHSQVALPFGPECYAQNPGHLELLRQTAGIIATSAYVQAYLRRWSDLESTAVPFPVHGWGPFQDYRNFDGGYVTMINPSGIKGLPIFLDLARRFPELPFAAVPTWATTSSDLEALRSLPNMTLLPRADDIDDIMKTTKVLIVPSLWGEAFGAVIVDAMLRGIPVIASDVGGTSEAKLGVDYLIPVHPIEAYETRVDERLIPVPVLPEQDMRPWIAALAKLTGDREQYERIAEQSKQAARAFQAQIRPERFVRCLTALRRDAAQGTQTLTQQEEARL